MTDQEALQIKNQLLEDLRIFLGRPDLQLTDEISGRDANRFYAFKQALALADATKSHTVNFIFGHWFIHLA